MKNKLTMAWLWLFNRRRYDRLKWNKFLDDHPEIKKEIEDHADRVIQEMNRIFFYGGELIEIEHPKAHVHMTDIFSTKPKGEQL